MQFSPQCLHLTFGFLSNSVTTSIHVINSNFSMHRKQGDCRPALSWGPDHHTRVVMGLLAWSCDWSLKKNQGHPLLRGWSHPKQGRSCSSELSSPAFPGLCGLSVLPPVISSSFCYPVNEADHRLFTLALKRTFSARGDSGTSLNESAPHHDHGYIPQDGHLGCLATWLFLGAKTNHRWKSSPNTSYNLSSFIEQQNLCITYHKKMAENYERNNEQRVRYVRIKGRATQRIQGNE